MKVLFSLILITSFFTACKRKWTEKDKSEFVSACMSTAVKDSNIGEKQAREYCHCIIDKIVEKYPNANDAQYIKYDKGAVTISRDCLDQIKVK